MKGQRSQILWLRGLLVGCCLAVGLPLAWADGQSRKSKGARAAKKPDATRPATSASHPATKSGAKIVGSVPLPGAKETPVKVQRYTVVSKGGMVAMSPAISVVYLEGAFPAPTNSPRVQMIQKDFAFVPQLLPVRTGTIVEFPNLDDTYHNVFSYSKAKRFDLGRYLPTERPIPSQTFDKPGFVHLHCDIHEHMRGVILVVDTPISPRPTRRATLSWPGCPKATSR